MLKRYFRKKESPWEGLLIGLASGLAATVVMTQFQNVWGEVAKMKSTKEQSSSSDSPGSENSENSGNGAEQKEPATEKAASKIAVLAGQELSPDDKHLAGTLVHYGFGTLMGGVYGLGMSISGNGLRRRSPLIPGALFGTGLFLAADEIALPALQLAEKPSKSGLGTHVYGLASHLVYGFTLSGLRRLARRVL